MRSACFSITAIASGNCSAQMTGTRRLMMAAFSPAIAVSVCPRNSVWSMLTGVITPAERPAAGPAEAKAFVDPNQRGRRIDMNAQVGGFQNRPQIGDRRPLAIGAGDMNHRWQLAFGMV